MESGKCKKEKCNNIGLKLNFHLSDFQIQILKSIKILLQHEPDVDYDHANSKFIIKKMDTQASNKARLLLFVRLDQKQNSQLIRTDANCVSAAGQIWRCERSGDSGTSETQHSAVGMCPSCGSRYKPQWRMSGER